MKTTLRSTLDVVATLSMIVASGAIIWSLRKNQSPSPSTRRPVPVPAEAISLNGAPILGDRAAKVALIEFSDFQCPYCGKFVRDTLPTLKAKYIDTHLVQLAFRQHPLVNVHPRAMPAAEAATCAGEQGKFWPMHDQLFANQTKLDDEQFQRYASSIGLDAKRFTSCIGGQVRDRINLDVKLADDLQLSGTPIFLVGRVRLDGRVKVDAILQGTRPINEFDQELSKLLKG